MAWIAGNYIKEEPIEDFISSIDTGAWTTKDAVCMAICDDEAFMLDLMEEKVKKILPSAVVEQFSSGSAGVYFSGI